LSSKIAAVSEFRPKRERLFASGEKKVANFSFKIDNLQKIFNCGKIKNQGHPLRRIQAPLDGFASNGARVSLLGGSWDD
jgi:hypothetical protein